MHANATGKKVDCMPCAELKKPNANTDPLFVQAALFRMPCSVSKGSELGIGMQKRMAQ